MPSRRFVGPEQVLSYLGRYTHRVAIANSRLISMDGDRVAFRWRDYRHRSKMKVMTLDAHEFIRRLLFTRCQTASTRHGPTASSPTAIARPPSSIFAADCWQDRSKTILTEIRKHCCHP